MLRFVAWTALCCLLAAASGRPVDGQGGVKEGKAPPRLAAREEQANTATEKAVADLSSAVVADPEAFRAVLAFRKAAAALTEVGEGRLAITFKSKDDALRIQKAEEALRRFDEAVRPKPKEKGPDVEASVREIDVGK